MNRFSKILRDLFFALVAAAFCSSAFAAKETFRSQTLTADQAYGGSGSLFVSSGSAQIFALAYGGGISRSDDSGATWTMKNSGLTSLNVRFMQANGAIPATVYATTTDGAGFYKSTNSGDTWVGLAAGTSGLDCRNVQNISVFTNSGNTANPHIFVSTGCPGSTSGLYKSEDGGNNWQKVPLNLPPGAVAQSVNFSFNSATLTYTGRVAPAGGSLCC